MLWNECKWRYNKQKISYTAKATLTVEFLALNVYTKDTKSSQNINLNFYYKKLGAVELSKPNASRTREI